ncbi:GGDEF domain-containing protein [Asanoa sp. NPDC049518]|uniref:GGDEF domain-containing protein n=1 Tax=unclassified Asanoa TaxID=2685164 RepID=UPI003426D26A
MSDTLQQILTAVGGLAAGIACAAALLVQQSRLLARACRDARHDDITGLPNRRALLAAAQRRLRAGRPFGLIIIDLDRFKQVNDTFGHATGNDVLTEIGRRLTALRRPVTVAARLSGDEFAVLVDGDLDDTAGAAYLAQRAIMATPVLLPDRAWPVAASVGYSIARLGVDVTGLLAEADLAMYHAKRAGGGVRRYEPSMAPTTPTRRPRDDR